ncbi:MAG: HAD-IA family hydrolase [Deltaproteobacteria bacterium]|nr:HAD-IA family hydrolase [Deltaproteobacteria bacterium]
MSGPAPRVVLFDFVGTLARVRGGVGRAYARYAAEAGVDADAAALELGFRAAFAAEAALPSDAGEARAAWLRIIAGSFEAAGRAKAGRWLGPGLYEWFATARPWQLYPDARSTLAALRAAGVQTGVVSNFDDRLTRVLAALGLDALLDTVTLPAEVGAAKPDPAIFRAAVTRHGAAPEQVWMVGDSEAEDVAGARAAGLRGIRLDRAALPGAGDGDVVATLSELAAQVAAPPGGAG